MITLPRAINPQKQRAMIIAAEIIPMWRKGSLPLMMSPERAGTMITRPRAANLQRAKIFPLKKVGPPLMVNP
jgi:hypothetical protein